MYNKIVMSDTSRGRIGKYAVRSLRDLYAQTAAIVFVVGIVGLIEQLGKRGD